MTSILSWLVLFSLFVVGFVGQFATLLRILVQMVI